VYQKNQILRRGLAAVARGGVAALGAGNAAAAAGVHGWPVRARGAGGWCGAAFSVRRWYSVCGRSGRDERARCRAAAAAGVHGWPVRARGAGGCCGGAFCVCRWYSVCGRCGRGERARGSARVCCAGWRYAAVEMRVGGPHGRGTLLRSCAPCNPAPLMTQILGAVQPRSRGSVPCAGPLLTATGEAGIRRGRFHPLLHCSIKNRFVPSIETNKATKSVCSSTCCVASVRLFVGRLILLP
jgi:hypothetical protein